MVYLKEFEEMLMSGQVKQTEIFFTKTTFF